MQNSWLDILHYADRINVLEVMWQDRKPWAPEDFTEQSHHNHSYVYTKEKWLCQEMESFSCTE